MHLTGAAGTGIPFGDRETVSSCHERHARRSFTPGRLRSDIEARGQVWARIRDAAVRTHLTCSRSPVNGRRRRPIRCGACGACGDPPHNEHKRVYTHTVTHLLAARAERGRSSRRHGTCGRSPCARDGPRQAQAERESPPITTSELTFSQRRTRARAARALATRDQTRAQVLPSGVAFFSAHAC